MESARGCGTSQNNFNMAPLPRGLWLVSGLPAPTNDYPVSLHPGLSARICMAQPNRSLEAAGETFFKRFPARAPSPAIKTARYGYDDGHQPPPVHDRLAQHSGGGGLKSITCVFGAGKNGDDFFWIARGNARLAGAEGERETKHRPRALASAPSSPRRGEGGPQGRMRGPKTQNVRNRPLIASLRSALLPAGEKRENPTTS